MDRAASIFGPYAQEYDRLMEQLANPFMGPRRTNNRTPKLQGEALAKAKGLTAYEVKEGVTIYAKNEAEAIKRAKKRGLL